MNMNCISIIYSMVWSTLGLINSIIEWLLIASMSVFVGGRGGGALGAKAP